MTVEDMLTGNTNIEIQYVFNEKDNMVTERDGFYKRERKTKQKLNSSSSGGPQYQSKALVPENINQFLSKYKKPSDRSQLWARILERNAAFSS